MQKALMEMNLQLHHVVSDITGATGMRIIHAIVAGERDPDEHIFALTQSLALYDTYQAKMADCDGSWRQRSPRSLSRRQDPSPLSRRPG
jgi:hypothetical protein